MTIGDNHWWDKNVVPPVRHDKENRMLIKGTWYDVIDEKDGTWNDKEKWFKIIDSQGSPHAFSVYTEEDKKNFPSHCDKYGPRDYEKWFYTTEELIQLADGTYKPDSEIEVRVGNYHWVKINGEWTIAKCYVKHSVHGKHFWHIIGSEIPKTDFDIDIEEIGEEVPTQKKHKNDKAKMEAFEELSKEIFTLVDAINKVDEDENYPTVEYLMPFVNKAVRKYFDATFALLGNVFDKL